MERDRADLAQLEASAPDVYRQYVAAAERLQVLETQEITGKVTLPPGQTLTGAIRPARAGLDAAVEAIRRVPGYSEFLKPPTFAQVQSAAQPGCPLVYFAVTPAGTLMLIVLPQTSEVSQTSEVLPVWSDLTEDALRERIQGPDEDPELGGYLGAYARWRRDPRDLTTRAAWFAALDGTTHWLWDVLVGPLVAALAGLGVERAVLIPQGWLGLLPLHAAWTDGTATARRRYALNDVCFTYAPNARALRDAADRAAHIPPDSLLAVDNPDGSLPNSAQEVAAACEHFDRPQVLGGEAATRQAVREQLPGYAVLHFSCHGMAGFTRPLEGGLVMAGDEVLTLRQILALRLENARLAVLAACETGVPGTALPDEVVSLPAGLMQAGVAGVVASLWSVSDVSTMMLMARFYELWRGAGLEPAEALRQAQFWVRDTTNGQKAAYFKGFLPEFAGERLPLYVADVLYKASVMARSEENDFEHPFHWAAFGYTGV